MGPRARLAELMRKREMLRARKLATQAGVLATEQGRALALEATLAGLIADALPPAGPITAQSLRAGAALGRRLEEQREVAANRSAFLADELATARSALRRHALRETQLAERVVAARSEDGTAREALAERQLPPGRRGRQPG
jgi:hypothetical protein